MVIRHDEQAGALLWHGRLPCQIQTDALEARELVYVVLMSPYAADQTPAGSDSSRLLIRKFPAW